MLESLITSKTRIKLLLKFFLNSSTKAYLRGLESEFGESTNAIRLELNRFEKAGMLSSQNEGNRKVFSANTSHPLFPEIQNLLRKHLGIDQLIEDLLVEIQHNIFQKALKFREENTTKVDTYEEFKERLNTKPGFILAHWDGTNETEAIIKEETKATIRCIPFDSVEEPGKCILTGKPSKRRVLFALSY